MAKQRGKFVDGAKKQRHQREEGRRTIFDLMEHFAGYGFNKAHSTAYALLAYQTAYLKANYPWHFAAALLTIEAQNTDKLALYLGECRERGDSGAAARHQREPAALHGRARQRRPLRPDRDQERRRGRDRVAARGAQEAGPDRVARTRSARTSICGWSTSACSRAWSRPARSIRWPGTRRTRPLPSRRRCGRGCSPRSTRRASTAPGVQRDRERRAGAAVRRVRRCGRPACGDGAGDASTALARGGAVDRDRAAGVREGNAGPVLERSSGRSLRRRAAGARREDDRRAA